MDAPQTPTDGNANAAIAPDVKATAVPAAEVKAPEQKQSETKPESEKALPGLSVEKPKEKAATRAGAPEKYDWKIEGDPKLVSSVTAKLEPMARSLGMSNDEVHGVYDTFAGLMRDNSKEMFKQWATALEQDKEFGGDKLEETLGLANSIVEQYGDDEFRGLLDKGGLRHNPAVVKLLARVAKDVGGDRMPRVPDQKVESGKRDTWYPTMKQ